jgi:hypothetical protein
MADWLNIIQLFRELRSADFPKRHFKTSTGIDGIKGLAQYYYQAQGLIISRDKLQRCPLLLSN